MKVSNVTVNHQEDGTPIKHPQRELAHASVKASYEAFKQSNIHQQYEIHNEQTISYDFFLRNMCCCLSKPAFETCVDMIVSKIHFIKRVIFNALTKSSVMRKK